MSLNVPDTLVRKAEAGKVNDSDFIAVVKESLPHAWAIFSRIADALDAKPEGEMAVHAPDHMEDAERGQLLRAMASNAIRGAVERHFGMVLAFQNCHITGGTKPKGVTSDAWKRFTSIEAQVLRQTPLMRDC